MPDLSGSSPPPQMPMPNGKLIPFDIDNISSWGGSSGNGMTGLDENESLNGLFSTQVRVRDLSDSNDQDGSEFAAVGIGTEWIIPFDNITISSWGGSSGNDTTGLDENESLSSCHTCISSYAARAVSGEDFITFLIDAVEFSTSGPGDVTEGLDYNNDGAVDNEDEPQNEGVSHEEGGGVNELSTDDEDESTTGVSGYNHGSFTSMLCRVLTTRSPSVVCLDENMLHYVLISTSHAHNLLLRLACEATCSDILEALRQIQQSAMIVFATPSNLLCELLLSYFNLGGGSRYGTVDLSCLPLVTYNNFLKSCDGATDPHPPFLGSSVFESIGFEVYIMFVHMKEHYKEIFGETFDMISLMLVSVTTGCFLPEIGTPATASQPSLESKDGRPLAGFSQSSNLSQRLHEYEEKPVIERYSYQLIGYLGIKLCIHHAVRPMAPNSELKQD